MTSLTTQLRSFLVDSFLDGDGPRFGDEESQHERRANPASGVFHLVGYLENKYGVLETETDRVAADDLDAA